VAESAVPGVPAGAANCARGTATIEGVGAGVGVWTAVGDGVGVKAGLGDCVGGVGVAPPHAARVRATANRNAAGRMVRLAARLGRFVEVTLQMMHCRRQRRVGGASGGWGATARAAVAYTAGVAALSSFVICVTGFTQSAVVSIEMVRPESGT
jgi:hypothetical protein